MTNEILDALQRAEEAGRFMVAVWTLANGKLDLKRFTQRFPIDDLPNALGLLETNLNKEMRKAYT